MSYTELADGVVISSMIAVNDTTNTLVITDRNSTENGTTSKRVKPVIWFQSGKWWHIPRDVIDKFKPLGYYLVAIPWTIKKPQLIVGQRRDSGTCHVLHCVRKELVLKWKGKVGPITSFAPRVTHKGVHIRGYYVGYHWDGRESLEEIPNHFAGKLTLKGRKPMDPRSDPLSAVRRLSVMVGKDGYCVGMEVRLTDREERVQRNQGEYHHTRPIILGNGFYVFDGVFKWQPILSNLSKPKPLPTRMASPMVFLGEGVHLITSTKHDGARNASKSDESYVRNVEISPSCESELASIVDWDLFERDFLR